MCDKDTMELVAHKDIRVEQCGDARALSREDTPASLPDGSAIRIFHRYQGLICSVTSLPDLTERPVTLT